MGFLVEKMNESEISVQSQKLVFKSEISVQSQKLVIRKTSLNLFIPVGVH